MNIKEDEFSAKILIVGDAGIGKSSVLSRFVDDNFKEHTLMT